ncbi:MAG: type IX secretion system membrane protein PorP/SprF [Bacteroidota bacterium]
MKKLNCIFIGVIFFCFHLSAQDPFFTHYYGNKSSFNPAFTGINSALTVGLKYRDQWYNEQASAFRTANVYLEESVPCFIMDYGFSVLHHQAGEGDFTRTEISGRGAFHLGTVELGKEGFLNGRFGFSATTGQVGLDGNQLVYLDQLDALYGLNNRENIPNESAFNLNGVQQPWYFIPSVGFLIRYISGQGRDSWRLDFSAAAHNLGLFSGVDARQSASLTGLEYPLETRNIFALSGAFVAKMNNYRVVVQPSLMYQRQSSLKYLEGGIDISFLRDFTFGTHYHFAQLEASATNTNWYSFRVTTGAFFKSRLTNRTSERLEITAEISVANGGLGNSVRSPIELGMALHFGGNSRTCRLFGSPTEKSSLENRRGTPCPVGQVSRGKRKIYDQIWYSDLLL